MAQTLTRLLIHAIFSTENRANLIKPDIEPQLYAYMGGICRNDDCPLHLLNMQLVEDFLHGDELNDPPGLFVERGALALGIRRRRRE